MNLPDKIGLIRMLSCGDISVSSIAEIRDTINQLIGYLSEREIKTSDENESKSEGCEDSIADVNIPAKDLRTMLSGHVRDTIESDVDYDYFLNLLDRLLHKYAQEYAEKILDEVDIASPEQWSLRAEQRKLNETKAGNL